MNVNMAYKDNVSAILKDQHIKYTWGGVFVGHTKNDAIIFESGVPKGGYVALDVVLVRLRVRVANNPIKDATWHCHERRQIAWRFDHIFSAILELEDSKKAQWYDELPVAQRINYMLNGTIESTYGKKKETKKEKPKMEQTGTCKLCGGPTHDKANVYCSLSCARKASWQKRRSEAITAFGIPKERILTLEQVAEHLHCSTTHIRNHMSNNKLPYHQFPGVTSKTFVLLFDRDEITQWQPNYTNALSPATTPPVEKKEYKSHHAPSVKNPMDVLFCEAKKLEAVVDRFYRIVGKEQTQAMLKYFMGKYKK